MNRTIRIPELDEAAKIYKPYRFWSEDDQAILRQYWRKVPLQNLARYLNRSVHSVELQAERLGLPRGRN